MYKDMLDALIIRSIDTITEYEVYKMSILYHVMLRSIVRVIIK